MLCISQFSPACKIGSVNKVKLSKICANWKKDRASDIFNKKLEFLLCQNRLLLCPVYVRIAHGVQENVSILEINIMSTSATTRTNWIYNDPKQHSAELDFLGGSRDI